ncbi:vancomycin high temperature exclusion protein [Plantactinospora sp. KLBMP9567]|uniref:SanA/YdcF family protein n=1 Tax=Plantactinospora sp. KLBMP9567 TaxID=3085900 RepID=UPI0029823953|nr:ElyC/SanA/YdcF family protein [Plantactinospora sp. KLBMP9567]MDW5325772.1 ElyC/SanA/YdcF family protein [Plantactinospora sp. KLBMP9567]
MPSASSPESSGSDRPRRVAGRGWRRRLVLGALVVLLLVPVSVVGSVVWVRQSAREHVYALADVPAAPVALVLGARVYPDGTPAPFLAARLELAKELLAAGKVRAILVSGDHRSGVYDEPGAMSRWLVERGVPARLVVQDHAGFDTYDSCSRARRVFGVDRTIVVTQSFHIERAVTVCRRVGLDAVGVGDDSVRRFERAWRWGGFREHFAAVKAVYDVVSGRDPVFLGPAEPGVRDALAG